MAKVFYTERDIEDMARQGVKSLDVNDNVVVTDLAREKARKLGLELITKRPSQPAQIVSTQATPAAPPLAANPAPAKTDLESRVFSSVKARLGDQVDDAVLHTIVERVIKGLGGK
jgi:hypothetical protein